MAIPMLVSFIVLWLISFQSSVGRVGVAMLLILFLYTFGENLEVLAYLYWPALVLVGIAVSRGDQPLKFLPSTQAR